MGAVYHGEQRLGTNVRRVAIKTLHKQLSTDAKVKARFNRECGTIAGLEHPNTIQVYDFGATEDGQLYIVMEFVQGKSLADALANGGAMMPDRALAILKQICGSLEEAHAQGIVHRDLKPDNIVLTDRAGQHDFVKVLDFGIAKRSGEEDKNEAKLTQAGMVLGTPPYMSPEQFTGKPIDVRSDIYSLGVMAYEMLTGRLPFEAETAWEWATKHMTVAPHPVEAHPAGMRAPEGMRQAVMRALAKRVEERFQSVQEFLDALIAGAGTLPGPRTGTAVLDPSALPPPRVQIHSSPGEPVSGRAATQAELAAMVGPGVAPTTGPVGPPPTGTALLSAHAGTPAAGNLAVPAPA
jgi:serine/threonine-protein kinase